jgi:hypothetical protein
MDVSTLKRTPAGTYKFEKAIQLTTSTPIVKDGVITGYKDHPNGKPIKEIDGPDGPVKLGDTFEPTLHWCGRHARLLDDGHVVKVSESKAVQRLLDIEELKKASVSGNDDELLDQLRKMVESVPKSKKDQLIVARALLEFNEG